MDAIIAFDPMATVSNDFLLLCCSVTSHNKLQTQSLQRFYRVNRNSENPCGKNFIRQLLRQIFSLPLQMLGLNNREDISFYKGT